ncbi:MAG TPA: hypothetical protein VHX86_18370 [Tepidisphaeraceae bacterium]|jgi:hypothetical protein|nr:hypothetical protein [Tepidisphaeraceae bacterium]
MATTLSNPQPSVQLKCQLTAGAAPAVVSSQVNHQPVVTLGAGNSAGNVDGCFSEPFTVSAGTPLTITLPSATDPLGNVLAMVHVTSVLVENDSTTSGQDFTVGGGTHPVLGTDQGTAQANGGTFFVINPNPGYSVVAGTSDTLQISAASGVNVPGKVTILGRSA